jgi:hypothetical protein
MAVSPALRAAETAAHKCRRFAKRIDNFLSMLALLAPIGGLGSMAKKSRRVKRKGQVRLSAAQMVLPGGIETADVPEGVSHPASEMSDLEEEYRHVILDLKRVGILAAATLATLIVLALVLV